MRFTVDGSWQRFGRTVIAGSPLRLFRLTPAGERAAAELEAGHDVDGSGLVDRLLDAGAIHPRSDGTGAGRYGHRDVTVVTPQRGGRAIADGRITVDDGSDPPIPGAAVRLEANAGPAAARNAGRDHVATPIVAFVDADVDTLDELGGGDWITPLLPHFDDDRVGLVAPRVCGETGSPLDLGPEPARIRARTRVSYVPAAAVLVRVSAFDEIGGFDETLRLGEDVDLVWRLDEAGWRCRYDPSVVVWHEPRATMRARLRQHADYGSSAAPLALRHPGALAPYRSNGWTAASWALVAAGHPLAAGALAAGSSLALARLLPEAPSSAVRLALVGHLRSVGQLAAAIRRAWWPLVAGAATVSRPMRWIGLAAVAARPAAAATDIAYGWGVWRGMVRTRSLAPIVPRLSSWPPRPPARRSGAPRPAPSAAGH